MKIISYNVNGIRAALTKGFAQWLQSANPDVLCLQEIKALETQIPTEVFTQLGYTHQYYHSAEKKGYSGVAILSKIAPKHIEGRVLRADFEDVSVMSLYLPSGTNPDRLDFKLTFMDDFQKYIDELKKKVPNLVICGDYNICHQAIDIHDPVRNATVSGFLPVERAWIDAFMKSGFIDSFRYFHKEPHQYSWWSYRANARNNNKGWRIDYHLVATPLENRMTRALILPEAHHSDHCPILLEIADKKA